MKTWKRVLLVTLAAVFLPIWAHGAAGPVIQPATQAQTDAGTRTDVFVSPKTLAGYYFANSTNAITASAATNIAAYQAKLATNSVGSLVVTLAKEVVSTNGIPAQNIVGNVPRANYADGLAPGAPAGVNYASWTTNAAHEAWPTLIAGPGGVLYMTHGEGPGHANDTNTAIVLKRSSDGGKTWTRLPVLSSPLGECRNHAFGVTSAGRLVVVQGNAYWDGSIFVYSTNRVFTSDDGGTNWTERTAIDRDVTYTGTAPFGRIVEFGGRLFGTIYHESATTNGNYRGKSQLMVSDDWGVTWTTNTTIYSHETWSCGEPSIVAVSPSLLICTIRHESTNAPYAFSQHVSTDGGTTWSNAGFIVTYNKAAPAPVTLTHYATPSGPRLCLWLGNRTSARAEVYDAPLTSVLWNPTNWQHAARTEFGIIGATAGQGGYVTAAQTDPSGAHLLGYYYEAYNATRGKMDARITLTNYAPALLGQYARLSASWNNVYGSDPILRITSTNATPAVAQGTAIDNFGAFRMTNDLWTVQQRNYSLSDTDNALHWLFKGPAGAEGLAWWVTAITGDPTPTRPMIVLSGMATNGGSSTPVAMPASQPFFQLWNYGTPIMSVNSSGNTTVAGSLTAAGITNTGVAVVATYNATNSFTLTATNSVVFVFGTNITVTLPDATAWPGRVVSIATASPYATATVTNATGTQWVFGTNLSYTLGPNYTASNSITPISTGAHWQ